jgi:hypothetical protein
VTQAPVAVFCFRRPKHLAETLDALIQCEGFSDSPVYVFSDGPRRPSDEPDIAAVREVIAGRRHPNMVVIEREQNLGLANSIIAAVNKLTNEYGKCIVVEDDLVLQPTALQWLNSGLDAYEDDERVMQISAYQYRVPEFANEELSSFQRFATTWGWATWRRAWQKFDEKAEGWEAVRDDPSIRLDFDAGGAYPFSDMLIKQIHGKIDSWGIRWSWSVFRNSGLTLMPPRSLVTNTGMDASGTHNSIGALKQFVSGPTPLLWTQVAPPALPEGVELMPSKEMAFRKALRRTNAMRNAKIKSALVRLGISRFAD